MPTSTDTMRARTMNSYWNGPAITSIRMFTMTRTGPRKVNTVSAVELFQDLGVNTSAGGAISANVMIQAKHLVETFGQIS